MKALHRAMSRPFRRRLRTAAVLVALFAITAGTGAAAPSKPTVVLRGSQAAEAPAPTPAPVPASMLPDPATGPAAPTDSSPVPRFQDAPAPRFSRDPAPRVGGLDLTEGGAQCRTACAQRRYLCRASEEPEICDSAWGQCVTSCTEASTGSL
jgi:hypothetical protein